jgi:hypothetical protein
VKLDRNEKTVNMTKNVGPIKMARLRKTLRMVKAVRLTGETGQRLVASRSQRTDSINLMYIFKYFPSFIGLFTETTKLLNYIKSYFLCRHFSYLGSYVWLPWIQNCLPFG